MNTIVDLLDKAYTNWNIAERVGAVGMELESRSRLPLARRMLGRAIELEPTTDPLWYAALAFAHFRDLGSLAEDGERTLVEGIEATDSDYLKAWHAAFVEEDEVAEQIFEIVRDSDDVNVRFGYGQALLWRGRSDEALAVFRAAVRDLPAGELPRTIDNYCGGMNWMRGQGRDIDLESEVRPYLERCIAAWPDVYQYRALLVQMYQVAREWDKVRDTALATLALFPDEETTMLALAAACEQLGDDEHARQWYNRAIGAKPSYARARIHLGRLHERLGQKDMAESVFRELPSANPAYHMGTISLACFLHRTGQDDEALSLFSAAYQRLKPFEKGGVENNPDARALLERMNAATHTA